MVKKELQELLIKARKEKGGLSQEDVASLSLEKITRQYYGMIESGDRRPSVKVAKSISQVLGVDWTFFFEVDSNHELQSEAI